MCEENTSQKERFLQEVEQKLLRKELDAKLLEDGLIRVKWNGQPLCSVDRDGIVRFRPADITGPEVDRQLRTVTQTAAQVKEYMQIFERAPTLKAIGLEDAGKEELLMNIKKSLYSQPQSVTASKPDGYMSSYGDK